MVTFRNLRPHGRNGDNLRVSSSLIVVTSEYYAQSSDPAITRLGIQLNWQALLTSDASFLLALWVRIVQELAR